MSTDPLESWRTRCPPLAEFWVFPNTDEGRSRFAALSPDAQEGCNEAYYLNPSTNQFEEGRVCFAPTEGATHIRGIKPATFWSAEEQQHVRDCIDQEVFSLLQMPRVLGTAKQMPWQHKVLSVDEVSVMGPTGGAITPDEEAFVVQSGGELRPRRGSVLKDAVLSRENLSLDVLREIRNRGLRISFRDDPRVTLFQYFKGLPRHRGGVTIVTGTPQTQAEIRPLVEQAQQNLPQLEPAPARPIIAPRPTKKTTKRTTRSSPAADVWYDPRTESYYAEGERPSRYSEEEENLYWVGGERVSLRVYRSPELSQKVREAIEEKKRHPQYVREGLRRS